jgi:hypothetical protein
MLGSTVQMITLFHARSTYWTAPVVTSQTMPRVSYQGASVIETLLLFSSFSDAVQNTSISLLFIGFVLDEGFEDFT